jgi:hypothetical protein
MGFNQLFFGETGYERPSGTEFSMLKIREFLPPSPVFIRDYQLA